MRKETKKDLYKELNALLKEYDITKDECYWKTGYEYNLNNYYQIKRELERRFG
jgi:hypothetical protein